MKHKACRIEGKIEESSEWEESEVTAASRLRRSPRAEVDSVLHKLPGQFEHVIDDYG